MKTKTTLEQISDGASATLKGGIMTAAVGSFLAATVGAVGLGAYEGATGQKVFGESGAAPAFLAGYIAPILAVGATRHRDDDGAVLGALACPIGSIASVALYGIGYGAGFGISKLM